jgi:cell division septum initiation protein DivIVA
MRDANMVLGLQVPRGTTENLVATILQPYAQQVTEGFRSRMEEVIKEAAQQAAKDVIDNHTKLALHLIWEARRETHVARCERDRVIQQTDSILAQAHQESSRKVLLTVVPFYLYSFGSESAFHWYY